MLLADRQYFRSHYSSYVFSSNNYSIVLKSKLFNNNNNNYRIRGIIGESNIWRIVQIMELASILISCVNLAIYTCFAKPPN